MLQRVQYDRVAFDGEHASTRNTESESENLNKEQGREGKEFKDEGVDVYHLAATHRRIRNNHTSSLQVAADHTYVDWSREIPVQKCDSLVET